MQSGSQDHSRLASLIAATATEIEARLDRELPSLGGPGSRIHQAMRYSVLGGGKRIRPFLVRAASELTGASDESALLAGAAVEMVHCYSLIHDDLPAMDDDDLRRGQPSCHKEFDEATAILAGDALLTLAVETLADARVHDDPAVRCELVRKLSAASGAQGMILGQMMDMEWENRVSNAEFLTKLARKKTGALIAFCCEAGAILGQSEPAVCSSLLRYGQGIGLAFQVVDDILDEVGDEVSLGKRVRKDAQAGKTTFPAMLGLDGAKQKANELVEEACIHLEIFGDRAWALRALAGHFLTRTH